MDSGSPQDNIAESLSGGEGLGVRGTRVWSTNSAGSEREIRNEQPSPGANEPPPMNSGAAYGRCCAGVVVAARSVAESTWWDRYLQELGYVVLRIPGYEVLRVPRQVLNRIEQAIDARRVGM